MNIKYLLELEKIIRDDGRSIGHINKDLNKAIAKSKELLLTLALVYDETKINFASKEVSITLEIRDSISTKINSQIKKFTVAEIEFKTLRDNFSKIIIPEYQRSFAWSDKTYIKFIESIKNKTNNDFNIGNIIISPFSSSSRTLKFGEEISVIDGQQRLTSLYGTLVIASYLNVFSDDYTFSPNVSKILDKFISGPKMNLNYLASNNETVIFTIDRIFNFIKKYESENDLNVKKKIRIDFNKKKLLNKGKQFFLTVIKKHFNSEDLELIILNIEKLKFTTNVTFGLEKAYKKFYETNAISVELSYIDIMRSVFYRFGFNRLVEWTELSTKFNSHFNNNQDIQFLNFYLKGELISPAKSFSKLESEMQNFSDDESKSHFLKSISKSIDDCILFKNNINGAIKDNKLAMLIWMFNKIEVNKQISNLFVVYHGMNSNFYVGKEKEICEILIKSIKAKYLYMNNSDYISPRSNQIDSAIKTMTVNSKINDSSDILKDLKVMEKYFNLVTDEADEFDLYEIFIWIINNKNISFDDSKTITIFLEGISEQEIFSKNNYEHLIPESFKKDKSNLEVGLFESELNECGIFVNNSIDSYVNLFVCDAKFNREVLSNKSIIDKMKLIIDNREKIYSNLLFEKLFNQIDKIISSDYSYNTKVKAIFKEIVLTKEEILKSKIK